MALKKCKECGGLVSTKAKTCPQCGAPVKQETPAAVGCLVIISIVVIIVAVMNSGLTNNQSSTQSGPPTPSQNSTTRPPAQGSVQAGDDARVIAPGQSELFLCVSTDAFSRFLDLAIAKDYVGMANMEAAGLAFSVPSGTKVKVIDPGVLKSEVRVMEGPHFSESGFVPAEWVTK